jgi:S-adenosylhomocysteine hydrolase
VAVAADSTGVKDATNQVAEGARSIGYGEVGSGVADLVVGVGRTIVEGTVYTGKSIGEFFKKAFGG